jgi:hypothetical protein
LILVYGGCFDKFFMAGAAWIVWHTLMRYTRQTPQKFARAMLFPFVGFNLAYGYSQGIFKPGGDWVNVVAIASVIIVIGSIVDRYSRRCEPLSSMEPTIEALVSAYKAASMRPGFTFGLGIAAVLNTVSYFRWPTLFLDAYAGSAWLAMYSVTMGRSKPPAKKERQPLRNRLPHLVPRLTPLGV